MLRTSFLIIISILLLSACDSPRPADRPQPSPAPQKNVVPVPQFDGEQAFRYLLKQTDFGPRAPGSVGHQKCLQYLQDELKNYADAVNLQPFSSTGPNGEQWQFTNIIASFNLQATDRILLTAHWDTRPWADQEQDPRNHKKPILGANDGASGVAVLLGIARQLKQTAPPLGVDIVLFDAEDIGQSGRPESFSAGSRYFAKNKPETFRPRFGINLDMIGDNNLEIPREMNSERYAPAVMSLVFSTARELGISQFMDSPGNEITDDHIPLNNVGIQTIDLIDFHYPDNSTNYWHTLADTPDKCNAESLKAVGEVLMHIVYSKALTIL